MAINYIPNDPLASWPNPLMRSQTPRPDPPSNRAGFSYHGIEPEGKHAFSTKGFLFWQCTEAALAALEAWADHDGHLGRWVNGRKHLDIYQNKGTDLNAYYDRKSVAFFEFTTGNKTTYSGASQDVVAHEVGHGLLDAIRPDLWYSNYLEVNAYHEAFGDCIAILTALDDQKTRTELLNRVPYLWDENFVEATAEDLADGIRRWDANHNAARPRHAFNWHNWDFPSNLPINGGPGMLLNESHSFGQIFTGCFWDTLGMIFNLSSTQTQTSLRNAARTVGRLLIAATRSVTETPRFTKALGEAMLQADQDQNNGANDQAIRQGFQYHNITLGTPLVAPVAAVSGAAPVTAATSASISSATRQDLAKMLGVAAGSRMNVRSTMIAGKRFAEATFDRLVPLASVDKRLAGVVAVAAESVVVGRHARGAAVMSALPQSQVNHDEVTTFVKSLVKHDCIDFGGKKKAARGARKADCEPRVLPTHRIRKVRGKKVLERLRVACPSRCLLG